MKRRNMQRVWLLEPVSLLPQRRVSCASGLLTLMIVLIHLARMEFSAGSSSSSSSSSFSWTAPREANAELSSDEGEVDRGKNGGGGIDADAERRELAAVCDFKGRTLRALEQEKEKLEAWVEAERRKRASDAKAGKADVETEGMRERLEEIRAAFVTLKTLTSFKVGPAGMRSGMNEY